MTSSERTGEIIYSFEECMPIHYIKKEEEEEEGSKIIKTADDQTLSFSDCESNTDGINPEDFDFFIFNETDSKKLMLDDMNDYGQSKCDNESGQELRLTNLKSNQNSAESSSSSPITKSVRLNKLTERTQLENCAYSYEPLHTTLNSTIVSDVLDTSTKAFIERISSENLKLKVKFGKKNIEATEGKTAKEIIIPCSLVNSESSINSDGNSKKLVPLKKISIDGDKESYNNQYPQPISSTNQYILVSCSNAKGKVKLIRSDSGLYTTNRKRKNRDDEAVDQNIMNKVVCGTEGNNYTASESNNILNYDTSIQCTSQDKENVDMEHKTIPEKETIDDCSIIGTDSIDNKNNYTLSKESTDDMNIRNIKLLGPISGEASSFINNYLSENFKCKRCHSSIVSAEHIACLHHLSKMKLLEDNESEIKKEVVQKKCDVKQIIPMKSVSDNGNYIETASQAPKSVKKLLPTIRIKTQELVDPNSIKSEHPNTVLSMNCLTTTNISNDNTQNMVKHKDEISTVPLQKDEVTSTGQQSDDVNVNKHVKVSTGTSVVLNPMFYNTIWPANSPFNNPNRTQNYSESVPFVTNNYNYRPLCNIPQWPSTSVPNTAHIKDRTADVTGNFTPPLMPSFNNMQSNPWQPGMTQMMEDFYVPSLQPFSHRTHTWATNMRPVLPSQLHSSGPNCFDHIAMNSYYNSFWRPPQSNRMYSRQNIPIGNMSGVFAPSFSQEMYQQRFHGPAPPFVPKVVKSKPTSDLEDTKMPLSKRPNLETIVDKLKMTENNN